MLHQRLIKLRDAVRLGTDKRPQFPNAVLVFGFGGIVHHRLCLHLSQVEDFFRKVIIIFTAAGAVDYRGWTIRKN